MRCTFANKERERERERESKEMKERKVSWKIFWKDISIYESRYKKNIPLRDEIIFHFLLFFSLSRFIYRMQKIILNTSKVIQYLVKEIKNK